MRKLLKISLASGNFLIAQLAATFVAAQDFGLTPTATEAGLATQGVTPESIAGDIIKALLGFLGLIAFVLVIYAGGLWMTAAGNDEKVTKAKDILKSAVIGLIIIFSAYAITSFVIERLAGPTLK